MKHTIIITAGGIGTRMGSEVPKQFLPVGGLPILMHTIRAFHRFDPALQLIVTLPKDWWGFWDELCETHSFDCPILLVEGGVERYDSIKNALSRAVGDIIAVHDGVRPFVNKVTFERSISCAIEKGSGIPVLPLKESLRKGSFTKSEAQERNLFFSVQTPQCFQRSLLFAAYQHPFNDTITDDASLVEKTGHQIQLVEGNEENIKITTPFDLLVAELIEKSL